MVKSGRELLWDVVCIKWDNFGVMARLVVLGKPGISLDRMEMKRGQLLRKPTHEGKEIQSVFFTNKIELSKLVLGFQELIKATMVQGGLALV